MTNGYDEDDSGLGLTEDQMWSFDEENVAFETRMDGYVAKKARDQMKIVNAAQQRANNELWQRVCQAAGLRSQEEYNQLRYTNPARATDIIANYHATLAQDFKNVSKEVAQVNPQAQRQPQVGMGLPTAGKSPVDQQWLARAKEKSQKQGLSDDELMDVLEDVLG